MISKFINDATGRFHCPYCSSDRLHYVEVPEHQRSFTGDDGSSNVEYMPTIRDYTCKDCEFEFALDPTQP